MEYSAERFVEKYNDDIRCSVVAHEKLKTFLIIVHMKTKVSVSKTPESEMLNYMLVL
jgi:hypothetical protein